MCFYSTITDVCTKVFRSWWVYHYGSFRVGSGVDNFKRLEKLHKDLEAYLVTIEPENALKNQTCGQYVLTF